MLNQATYADLGHIGEAIARRGMRADLVYREEARWSDLPVDASDLLVLLGSMWSPLDAANRAIETEVALIDRARRVGTPVLGVCYGAQVMALSRGARLFQLIETCFGFHDVRMDDDSLPSGPQFFWNHVGFLAPSDSRVVASGPESCWVFEDDRGIAVQFHPDATPTILKRWMREGAPEIEGLGADAATVVAESERVATAVGTLCDLLLERLLARGR